jgi:anti-sigma factor RsiW
MTECLRYAPMIGAREGELSAEDASALRVHLAQCAACRAREADLRSVEGLVADALLAEASRRDFAPFVDGVMARVSARRSGVLGLLRRFRFVHPRLALGSMLAPLVAAAALAAYLGLRDRGPEIALELNASGNVDTVLQTSDGPVVLLGADEAEGS